MDNRWREDFPILKTMVYGQPLVYLDNAATSQMPEQVIRRITDHYEQEHANVHRGIHFLSERSTESVEAVREKVAFFIGARSPRQIIFTQGTTDSIHLVSAGMSRGLRQGEAVVSTELEHHSNYVPWQQICRQTNASFLVCSAGDGELDLHMLERLLRNHSVRLVAVAQVSNLTGTVTPLREIIPMAHAYGAEVLVDGAQGILHEGVDVTELDADWYVFSGHKMLGPTGIGVLYGKERLLESLPPVRFGGGMTDLVTAKESTWEDLPWRLEAGTPNISGIIGLGEAVQYLQDHCAEQMRTYEKELTQYALERLRSVKRVRILGHPQKRASVISFMAEGVHPYDLATLMDKKGIAVRSGKNCAMPALGSLGEEAAVRISIAFYNTKQEIDMLCDTLNRIIAFLAN